MGWAERQASWLRELVPTKTRNPTSPSPYRSTWSSRAGPETRRRGDFARDDCLLTVSGRVHREVGGRTTADSESKDDHASSRSGAGSNGRDATETVEDCEAGLVEVLKVTVVLVVVSMVMFVSWVFVSFSFEILSPESRRATDTFLSNNGPSCGRPENPVRRPNSALIATGLGRDRRPTPTALCTTCTFRARSSRRHPEGSHPGFPGKRRPSLTEKGAGTVKISGEAICRQTTLSGAWSFQCGRVCLASGSLGRAE